MQEIRRPQKIPLKTGTLQPPHADVAWNDCIGGSTQRESKCHSINQPVYAAI